MYPNWNKLITFLYFRSVMEISAQLHLLVNWLVLVAQFVACWSLHYQYLSLGIILRPFTKMNVGENSSKRKKLLWKEPEEKVLLLLSRVRMDSLLKVHLLRWTGMREMEIVWMKNDARPTWMHQAGNNILKSLTLILNKMGSIIIASRILSYQSNGLGSQKMMICSSILFVSLITKRQVTWSNG